MNDMTRVEAYHILGKMWEDATQEQAEAISMAQNDIEFVDLMQDDIVAVVRCKDCKHRTNADRIRAMSDEELAKWLADIFDCHDCSEHERLGDNPLLSDEQRDQECEKHCLDWLKQPCEEGDGDGR